MAKPIVTGVVYRGGTLDYTTVRESSVLRRKTRSEGDEQESAGILFEDLKQDHTKIKGDLHYALPASRALLRVVDLPSEDPEEIEGMAELQIDKMTPFPLEQMYVGTEILTSQDGNSRVLISAIQKKFVDHAGDSFKEAGLTLKRVDIDVLAWIEVLRNEGRLPAQGRHIILFNDQSGLELAVIEDGEPLWFRSLGIKEEESEQEFMEDMSEELEYTLANLEGEWGSRAISSLTMYHNGAAPRGLGMLGDAVGVSAIPQRLDSLPTQSEGIALRAARLGENGLDLAPLRWADEEAHKQSMIRMITAAVAILAAWLGVVVGFGMFQKHGQARLDYLFSREAALAPKVLEAEQVQVNIDRLTQFHDRTYSSLQCLAEVVDSMPAQTEFTGYSYRKKDRVVRIDGVAGSSPVIDSFESKLEKLPLFERIDLVGRVSPVTTGRHKGKQKFTFDCFLPGAFEEEGEEY